ncbi:interleukin 17a/f3 [Myripristis murdjan]|uniref:interleukin 17a/f3 n=1 Tax=Myripristis murdjan TaxID=586833 RepID=UPI0011760331|nr:interleukin-17F-like [Myripristis murdjan]
MLLAFRALLVLGLVALLHGNHSVKVQLGTKQKNKTVRLILDNTLQSHIGSMSASRTANMSLSPWTYRSSCVASRFPQRISYAQCLTSGCVSPHGEGEDMALEAKPIYYQVLVLHREKIHGWNKNKQRKKYAFRLATETITVGCTCVRPSVVAQH